MYLGQNKRNMYLDRTFAQRTGLT